MAKSKGRNSDAALAEKLAAGVHQHLANAGNLLIDDGSFTAAQVIAKLDELAKLRNDVDAAKAVVKAKLAAEKSQAPALREFMLVVVLFVKAAFGSRPDVLADFGIAPKKTKTPLTAEQKAAAAVKRNATREARGTVGSKKRKQIKGNVTGIKVTPVIAPEPQPVEATPNAPTAPNAAPGGATGNGNAAPHGA